MYNFMKENITKLRINCKILSNFLWWFCLKLPRILGNVDQSRKRKSYKTLLRKEFLLNNKTCGVLVALFRWKQTCFCLPSLKTSVKLSWTKFCSNAQSRLSYSHSRVPNKFFIQNDFLFISLYLKSRVKS